eukprot:m.1190860 g.1190860  ORF g.1190860 m.1190860 type:complete len:406 (+) comp24556_c1_seq25:154-1371(+)
MMEEAGSSAPKEAPAAAEPKTADPKGIRVSIADALNEQDIVKFTVHTQTELERFAKKDFQVTRLHEEFVWLFERFTENDQNAGYIIPPPPPKPDFSQSHGKLAKLQSGDAQTPQDELDKLKQEIQSEYLAAFQKTVAMHEVFLIRLASHPVLREDQNLQVFLEYDQDLSFKHKSKKDKAIGFMKGMVKSLDNTLVKHVDEDSFFENQKAFIFHYIRTINDAQKASVQKVKHRQSMVAAFQKVGVALVHLANTQHAAHILSEMMRKTGQSQTAVVSIQKKLCAKEDLKMSDLLKYYKADSDAAKDLMVRRVKALNDQNKTASALDAAKAKGKKVLEAQDAATNAKDKFEKITKSSKDELKVFKKRRIAAFRKGLIQYTQCQIRQSREMYALMKQTLAAVKEIEGGR